MEAAGQHLKSELKRLGFTQVDLSMRLGVSRQTVNNIINGRQEISRSVARRLGLITGQPPDYWLRSSFRQRRNSAPKALTSSKPHKKKAQRRIPIPHDNLLHAAGAIGDLISKRRLKISSWAELRVLVRRTLGDDALVEARAFWRDYQSSINQ
jgi:addiction module HigA family antidote